MCIYIYIYTYISVCSGMIGLGDAYTIHHASYVTRRTSHDISSGYPYLLTYVRGNHLSNATCLTHYFSSKVENNIANYDDP